MTLDKVQQPSGCSLFNCMCVENNVFLKIAHLQILTILDDRLHMLWVKSYYFLSPQKLTKIWMKQISSLIILL